MPKSFMIRGKHFPEDDATVRPCVSDEFEAVFGKGTVEGETNVGSLLIQEDQLKEGFYVEIGCHEMMPGEGTEKEEQFLTSQSHGIKASSAYTNRRLVNQRSIDKSSSDGESDSGCSSLNDGRQELPVEEEYSSACPSSLSFLIDLMTQSPQRNSGRDVSDLCYDTHKYPRVQDEKGSAGKMSKMDQQQQQQQQQQQLQQQQQQQQQQHHKRQNESGVQFSTDSSADFGVSPMSDFHPLLSQYASNPKGKWDNRYYFELSPQTKLVLETPPHQRKTSFMKSSLIGNASPSMDVVMATEADDIVPSVSNSNSVMATSHAPVHYSPAESVLPPLPAHRKICFDEYTSNPNTAATFLNYEEPIDYSQLSSRRKSQDEQRAVPVEDDGSEGLEERTQWPGTIKGEVYDAPNSGSMVSESQVGFAFSPQLSSDVKPLSLTRNQDHSQHSQGDGKMTQDLSTKVQQPCQSALFPSYENNKQGRNHSLQSSPLPASPASLMDDSSDAKSWYSPMQRPYSRKLHKVVTGQETLKEDAETIYRRMAYHPKLKYLLASSQNRSPGRSMTTGLCHESRSRSRSPENDRCEFHQREIAVDASVSHRSKQISMRDYGHEQDVESKVLSDEMYDTKTKLSYPTAQNQYAYSGELQSGSIIINKDLFTAQTTSSVQPISSIIAQLNQISEVRHKSREHGNNNNNNNNNNTNISDNNNKSPILLNHSVHPMFNVSSQLMSSSHSPSSPTSLSSSLSPPSSSSSSSPSSSQNPHRSRDQQSALTELLFSTTVKPPIDPYACADCGKRYSTSSNLARHRQTHRSVCDKKARKCPHCEKVYVSMPAFSMHVRTHNQGCECPHCGKKFSRPWLLQGHIRTHTGEKPFGCPKCGKSFADKSNLRAHIQTHSTEKPYVCGRCGKAFALKSYLYKHEESSCMRGQRFRH